MTEITISLEQYNMMFEKALIYDRIVDMIKSNIDKGMTYPVKDDDMLLLTGLTKYADDHKKES